MCPGEDWGRIGYRPGVPGAGLLFDRVGGSRMSDVSIIGTGAMGSALVEALAAAEADVTVWNRTTD